MIYTMACGLDRIIWYRFATLIYVKLYAAYDSQILFSRQLTIQNGVLWKTKNESIYES